MEVIHKSYLDTSSNSLGAKDLESKLREKRFSHLKDKVPQAAKLAGDYTEGLGSVPDTRENRVKLELALKALEAARPSTHSRYQVHINTENQKLQLQLINYQTGEVIEEIPSRRLLDFYSAIEELNSAFFEEKA